MNNKGFRLLSKDELENSFTFYKKIFSNPSTTDYSEILGVCSHLGKNDKGRKGFWWLRDIDESTNTAYCIDYNGNLENANVTCSICGIRPIINYSLIKPYQDTEYDYPGYKLVEFGEYPSTAVHYSIAEELERRYLRNILKESSDSYTYLDFNGSRYGINKFPVYEYQGKKYFRSMPTFNSVGSMHDGTKVSQDKIYWLRVSPVSWIVDEENDIAIPMNIILGGIPFSGTTDIYNYDQSFIKMYLEKCFAKEIVPNDRSYKYSFLESLEDDKKEDRIYDLDLGKVSEEDILRGAVESDVSVFIHGKSGDGKSARVKELDPDCEIIYMRNATPESLNGKSVYDGSSGKMLDVPPTWYKRIVDKCNSEPDKIHILFFDELTNALPSIQGMAFNIVLNKEINGKWKLPKNVRVVAAGNDIEDSLAAYRMAEPLFNRFAHTYVNTTVEDWLEWAMGDDDESQKLDYKEFEDEEIVHPAIVSYIESRYNDGVNVLRTPYTGDKPNADPRKWEMASQMLYRTKKLRMLRALVGEFITNDFAEFINVKSNEKFTLNTLVNDMNEKILTKGKNK